MINYSEAMVSQLLDHTQAKTLVLPTLGLQLWVRDEHKHDKRVQSRVCAICEKGNHNTIWRPSNRTLPNRNHRICPVCLSGLPYDRPDG